MSTIIVDQLQPNIGGQLSLDGNVLVNGNLSADTLYGNSDNLTRTINNIIPAGSGLTDVSAYLQYGVNLISTATTEDFCVRLPQTPIEGRDVTVINTSGFDIFVYPSVDGGSVNGTLNGSAVVPSDSRAYNFYCYENPNPGAWSASVVQPNAGVYSSGEISIDTSQDSRQYVSAYNNVFKNVATQFSSVNCYASLASPNILYVSNPLSCGSNSGQCSVVYFRPSTPWAFIDKVTVYTNFSTGTTEGGIFGLVHGREDAYYSAGTLDFLTSMNLGSGNIGTPVYGGCDQIIAGTANATNGFTITTGEPGTWFGELVYSAATRPTQIGTILLSSGTMDTGMPYGVVDADKYHIKYVAFIFDTNRNSADVKFRFEIDYRSTTPL